MTIEAELNALDITKSAIKQAIIGKGVPVSASDSFSTYPAKIEQIQTGSEPTLETLTVTPSTTAQTLTPPSGVDGFDEVSVNAVTAAIDSDIQAGNIKSGVEILGVTGTYTGEGANLQSKTLTVDSTTPTVSTVAPDTGYDGLSSVTVDMTYVEDRLDTVLGTSVGPTGTLSITANGVYDVTNYASANVSVAQQPRYLKATINGSNFEPSEDQYLDMQDVDNWLSDKEITVVLMLENSDGEAIRLMPANTPYNGETAYRIFEGEMPCYLSCHVQDDELLSYPVCGEGPGSLPDGMLQIYWAYVEGSNYTQTYNFISMGNMPYISSDANITIFTDNDSEEGIRGVPIYLRTTEDIVFLPVY